VPARNKPLNTTGQITSAMLDVAADFGFAPVASNEVQQALQMTALLMKHEVTSEDTILSVQRLQKGSSLVYRQGGEVTAVVGILLLRPEALNQLMNGAFDAMRPSLDLLSRADEAPACGYSWGIAASTKPAGAAAMAMGMSFRSGPLSSLLFFTRAVSSVGRHVALTRGGYEPLRRPDDDLLVRRPAIAKRRAA